MGAAPTLRGSVAFVAAVLVAGIGSARGRSEHLFIDLPPTIIATPGHAAHIDLRVGPPERLPRQAYIRIRGLPARFALTGGHPVSSGVWAVPLYALARLELVVPPDASGSADVTTALIDIDGRTLAEARVRIIAARVNLGTPPADGAEASSVPPLAHGLLPVPAPVPAGKPDRTRLNLELEQLLADADRALLAGDLAFARQIYRHVAGKPHALAAFKLAETFDPLAPPGTGVRSDASEARHWYARARDLGESRAASRLEALKTRD